MIKLEQKEGEDRKTYLVRIAIAVIESSTGYSHDEIIFYDDCECDGGCLADDLSIEFQIGEYDYED